MSKNNSKLSALRQTVQKYKRVLIAFSGGVDSTFLLKVCVDVLGKENVIAVTAVSDTYTKDELRYAKSVATDLGVAHILLETDEMSDSNFLSNTPERCYSCKKHLFSSLKDIAEQYNIESLVDASNTDDEDDYRPGHRAAKEFSIKSPLIEVGITKQDIRRYSRMLGLTSWDKPANPCLASRIPYGCKITRNKLEMVQRAEMFLRRAGLKTVRVRHHGKVARIEVLQKDIKKLVSEKMRAKMVDYLKNLGFTWIAVDLEGYRQGSLNEILPKQRIK
jgi:uncharacterized protein